MKGNARTAVLVGAGYVLGRRHKLRTAALLAAATAAGSTPVGGLVLRRGAKLLGSAGVLGKVAGTLPPEIADLVDTVRGDLVPAGKAAVSAAASSRVAALTDSLHERAELVRDPGAAVADTAGTAKRGADEVTGTAKRGTGEVSDRAKRGADEVTTRAKRKTRGARRAEEDREPDEDLAEDPDEDREPDEEEPDEEEDLAEDPYPEDEEDEDEDEPVTRVRRTGTRRRATVTRTRR